MPSSLSFIDFDDFFFILQRTSLMCRISSAKNALDAPESVFPCCNTLVAAVVTLIIIILLIFIHRNLEHLFVLLR